MDRRTFVANATAVAMATATTSRSTSAQGSRKLRLVTPWPKDSPGLSASAERLAGMINESSEGRLHVEVFAAGELVEAFEIFDAVSAGVADMYHSPEYYWQEKSPAFNYFGAVPFGLTANEMTAWLYYGGGQLLWDELSSRFNLKPLLTASTGIQMGGWYAKQVTSIESFEGLRIRIPGLGGEVLKRMGAIVVSLPGGEIVPALQSGAIDASEWVGPWLDSHLGLQHAARYYYYPGFHEPGPAIALGINKDIWDSLNIFEQRIIRTATTAEFTLSLAEFNIQNSIALQGLKEQGVSIRRFGDELLYRIGEITTKVLDESSTSDPLTRRIHDSYFNFRTTSMHWSDISDRAYMNARRVAFPANT